MNHPAVVFESAFVAVNVVVDVDGSPVGRASKPLCNKVNMN
jgi:hypothetical protein